MGLNPDYNQTVTLDSQNNVTVAELLRAVVPRDDIRGTSASSVSDLNNNYDIYPTSGRLGELADGTLVVGDGSSWQDAQSFVQPMATGLALDQRGDPTSSELAQEDAMLFISDGSGTGAAGDLVYAFNDGGTIETVIVQAETGAA